MRTLLVLIAVSSSFVAASAETRCHQVGGSISTNFLDAATTFGSATGDLGGGVGVSILSLNPNSDGTLTFHNQHHWVTTTGDTINVEAADATGFPTAIAGFYAASYTRGIGINGGTGAFKNARGKIFAWGAVNTVTSEIVLRYEGSICSD
jgi:hypothetical protein